MDSCLDCRAHEVTLFIHNGEVFWLQVPRCRGEHFHGEWVAHPRATEVGSCAFSCDNFACKHNNILEWHYFRMGLYLSWWHLFNLWLSSLIFFAEGNTVALQTLDCNLNSGSKSLIYVSSIATIRRKNSWSSTSNLSFSKIAMCRRFCVCSAVKQCETNRAQFFSFFFKSLHKIRNTDVPGTPVTL